MEAKEATVKATEWQPRGYPYLMMSPDFKRAHDDWRLHRMPGVCPYASVEFLVSDALYRGPIVSIKSKASAVGPGAPKDSLISYQILNRNGIEIAKVNTRGEGTITIIDTSLKRKEIAEALEGVKEALERGQATAYTAYGLYRRYPPTEMQRRKIPDDQIVKDGMGNPRRDERGNTWVISGEIKQHNTQQVLQKSAR